MGRYVKSHRGPAAGQSDDYIDSLILEDIPTVAVDAGTGQRFRGLVGRRGMIWRMKGFGASGPHTDLAKHFGYTPGQFGEQVRKHLGK